MKKRLFLIFLILFTAAGLAFLGYNLSIFLKTKESDDVIKSAVKSNIESVISSEKISSVVISSSVIEEEPLRDIKYGEIGEIPVDFEKLKEQNSDIYAWIRIKDSTIDYPVLRTEGSDYNYYLNHTVTKKSGLPGAIYTQSKYNSRDFNDRVTVIYGHNMKNGTFFGNLHKYEKQDYLDAHKEIEIYLEDRVLKYEISFVATYSSDHLLYHFDTTDISGTVDLIEALKANSLNKNFYFDESLEVFDNDRIIILSTCNGNKTQRYLVGAVLKEEYILKEN